MTLHSTWSTCSNIHNFNPHSHEGSDQDKFDKRMEKCQFQSTLPRRERQLLPKFLTNFQYFNPHSHEGSDIRWKKGEIDSISIHTPTKGATDHRSKTKHVRSISIHTPTKGATATRGVRQLTTTISIHTPTKGATGSLLPYQNGINNFNPHSHEGSDTFGVLFFHFEIISIHTPTKGATGKQEAAGVCTIISIHTPTKGATAILTNNFLIFCSISLINFILYLQIIQILFIFRYKFIFYFIF